MTPLRLCRLRRVSFGVAVAALLLTGCDLTGPTEQFLEREPLLPGELWDLWHSFNNYWELVKAAAENETACSMSECHLSAAGRSFDCGPIGGASWAATFSVPISSASWYEDSPRTGSGSITGWIRTSGCVGDDWRGYETLVTADLTLSGPIELYYSRRYHDGPFEKPSIWGKTRVSGEIRWTSRRVATGSCRVDLVSDNWDPWNPKWKGTFCGEPVSDSW